MKKKLFLAIFLPLLFLLFSSFGYPQDTTTGKVAKEDSLYIKFQNPNITVNDTRNLDIMQSMIDRNLQTDSEVASAIRELNVFLPYIVESQERRYESALDYLSRTSGQPTNKIIKYIRQKRLIEAIQSVVLMTYILFNFLYIIVYTNEDWRKYLSKIVSVATLGVLLYIVLSTFLSAVVFGQMTDFYSLMQLIE